MLQKEQIFTPSTSNLKYCDQFSYKINVTSLYRMQGTITKHNTTIWNTRGNANWL